MSKDFKRKAGTILGCCLILLCLSAVEGGTHGVGLTLSTNTFLQIGKTEGSPVEPGLYARAGASWLPGDHLEIEIFHIPQITPRFYSQVFLGFSVGYWLVQRKTTSYFNITIDAGFLYGLDHTKLLGLQLSPIVLGGPDYNFADRFLTFGILYDPDRRRAVFELRLLTITLFL